MHFSKRVFSLFNFFKAFFLDAINYDGLIPHRRGANPKAAFAVEGFVNHHIFKRFGVMCQADNAVHAAFVVAVNARNITFNRFDFFFISIPLLCQPKRSISRRCKARAELRGVR